MRTTEPEQLGERRVAVERDAPTPLIYVAYKSPAANIRPDPAINLLMSILTEGDASRLHRLLVEEKKLAIAVAGSFQEGFDPGLAGCLSRCPTAPSDGGEQALDAALAQVVTQGVTDAELVRARNLSPPRSGSRSPPSTARRSLLGSFEVFEGDYRKLFDRRPRMKR